MMTVPGASRVGKLTIWRFSRAGISTTVPSSDGADCTDGGADCGAGIKMKGSSCSGVAAAAAPENAMVPIASAPKVAARQEFSLNASGLNIGRPCLIAIAPVRRVVVAIAMGRKFQDVCVKHEKWFRRARELFRGGVATKQCFRRPAPGAAILADGFTPSLSCRMGNYLRCGFKPGALNRP